jgi:hypothetical protein
MMSEDGKKLAVELAKDAKQRIEKYIAEDVPAQVAYHRQMKLAMLGEDAHLDPDVTAEEILTKGPEGTIPAHLLWLCDQMVDKSEQWPVTRLHRWVGYIQGCMVSRGIPTSMSAVFDLEENSLS